MEYIIITCPECEKRLNENNFDVISDVAICPNCNQSFKLSDHIWEEWDDGFLPNNPPSGITFQHQKDCFRLDIKPRFYNFTFITYSIVSFIFLLAIVFFMLISLEEGPWIFRIIVFIMFIGWIFIVSILLKKIESKISIELTIEKGVIQIRRVIFKNKYNFSWNDIVFIREIINYKFKKRERGTICLEGGGVEFGDLLSHAQRRYILKCLRTFFRPIKENKNWPVRD